MMMPTARFRRHAVGLIVAIIAATVAIAPAAATDMTQTITAGTRSASIPNLSLPGVAYSHSAATSTGTMALTADDSTGSNLGWNVTIQSSDWVYSGGNGGSNVPAVNLSLTSASAATMTAGQAVDALGVGGPKVPVTSPLGTLDTARKVLHALTTFGNGTYTQTLGVSLAIPAQSAAGTYTGTLTTTISAAP